MCSAAVYHIHRNFRQEKNITNFANACCWRIFFQRFFFFCTVKILTHFRDLWVHVYNIIVCIIYAHSNSRSRAVHFIYLFYVLDYWSFCTLMPPERSCDASTFLSQHQFYYSKNTNLCNKRWSVISYPHSWAHLGRNIGRVLVRQNNNISRHNWLYIYVSMYQCSVQLKLRHDGRG